MGLTGGGTSLGGGEGNLAISGGLSVTEEMKASRSLRLSAVRTRRGGRRIVLVFMVILYWMHATSAPNNKIEILTVVKQSNQNNRVKKRKSKFIKILFSFLIATE
jgi:hypothetical protein